jgi:hypothetical protein
MHLIDALIAGIRGAELGSARIYARGTTTRAAWYVAFEGGSSSTADISLDSNGGAEVYVNQPVDVVVYSTTGATIRNFTSAHAASAIEVRSDSFTGTDYSTGASGTSKPTTLQAVLDAWDNSAGASDWKVLYGGVATNLSTIASGVNFFVNVKSPTYGATGNGTTDDRVAIQAAIDAANTAGGGVVFFPAGTYRVTSALTMYGRVSLLGVGANASILTIDHATAHLLTYTTTNAAFCSVQGMTLKSSQTSTGRMVNCAAIAMFISIRDCAIGDASYLSAATASSALVYGTSCVADIYGCVFRLGASTAGAMVTIPSGNVTNCDFSLNAAVYGNPAVVSAVSTPSGEVRISGCRIIGAPDASSAFRGFYSTSSSMVFLVSNCQHHVSTAGQAMFGSLTTGGIKESGCIATSTAPLYAGGFTTGHSFNSRANNYTSNATVTGNVSLSTLNYGKHSLTITASGAAHAISFDADGTAPYGSRLVVVIRNSSGGVTGNVTFPTATTVAAFTIANTKTRTAEFELANGIWYLVSLSADL